MKFYFVILMDSILLFYRDLTTLPKSNIYALANFYNLSGSYNDLCWMIAIHNSRQYGQMILQTPIMESLAKNMTIEEVLNYANINRLTDKNKNIMLRNAKVSPDIVNKLKIERRWNILEQVLFNPNLNIDSIEELSLADMPIYSLKSLKRLTELKTLFLQNLPLQSLDGIESLKNLLSLTIVNCPIENIRPIQDLTKLIRLHLITNEITDINGIEKLKSLIDLKFIRSPIDNISLLSQLIRIRFLNLSSTYIDNIESLKNLDKLEVLNISDTGVTDISPLLGLKNLRKVIALDTRIRNFRNLENNNIEIIKN